MEIQYDIDIYEALPEMDYQISICTTILSVLDGKIWLKFEDGDIEVCKGELFLLNFGKLYSMEAVAGTIISELKINYEDILKNSKKKDLRFYCDTKNDLSRNHYQIKNYYSKLLRLHVLGDRPFDELSTFYGFLSILMRKYIRISKENKEANQDNRMNDVRLYLHTHYNEKMTLEDICRRFYFSISTFTRNFKKETNQSMIQYINSVRVQEAKKLLLDADSSVTDIALEVGFSDVATFNKTFKKITGMAPLKYKKSIIARKRNRLDNEHLIHMVNNTLLVDSLDDMIDGVKSVHRRNEISKQNLISFDKSWTSAIGVQYGSALLDSKYQEILLQICKKMKVRYLRIPMLLSDTLIVQNKNDYDFSKIDTILDFVISHSMIPIIELSGRKLNVTSQEALMKIEEIQVYHYSQQEWMHLLRSFITHIMCRYAGLNNHLKQWIWEYQYERNTCTLETYVNQFNQCLNEIKKWSDVHQIGGYGIDLYDWDELEIKKLHQYSFQPDYISINIYPYKCKSKKDNIKYLERLMDYTTIKENMDKLKQTLKQYGYQQVPLYVTQWNTTLSDHSVINDSSVKAILIMNMVTKMLKEAELFIYDDVIDFDIFNQNDDILYGGKGLVSKDGLEKTCLNTMVGLSDLGHHIVQCSENVLFSYLSHHQLYGICFNRKTFNMSYYQEGEDTIKLEGISRLFDDMDILEQEISISDLENGLYRIRIIRISYEKSILLQNKNMCDNLKPSLEDIEYLKNLESYDVKLMNKRTVDQHLDFTVSLRPNEIVLMHIYPIQFDH